MALPMARYLEGSRQPGRNWGLFLLLGLCVEFWIAVTTVVAQSL
jgi:hypothetical protein